MNLRKLSAEAAISIFGRSLFKYCFVWVPLGTPTNQVQARIKKDYPHLSIWGGTTPAGKYLVLPVESTARLYDVSLAIVRSISATAHMDYKDFFVVDDFCWALYCKELCT